DAGISALIGTRLRPGRLLASTALPACTDFVVDQTPVASGGWQQSRIQVDLWARSYMDVWALRDAWVAFCESRSDMTWVVGPDAWEEESELWHRPLDIIVSHKVE